MNTDFLESVLESLANTDVKYFKLESPKKKVEIIKGACDKQDHIESKSEESKLIVEKEGKKVPEDDTFDITSPHVGFFRRSQKSGGKPLVKLREVVEKQKLVAYISSMNFQYEVISDFSGKIVEILVEDGQAVEFAQPLFRLRQANK